MFTTNLLVLCQFYEYLKAKIIILWFHNDILFVVSLCLSVSLSLIYIYIYIYMKVDSFPC